MSSGSAGHPDAANLTYLGLYAMQHRGQESAGIVTWEKGRILVGEGDGLRGGPLRRGPPRRAFPGSSAIGHVRYSTSGESRLENAQPIVYNTNKGPLAIGTTATS